MKLKVVFATMLMVQGCDLVMPASEVPITAEEIAAFQCPTKLAPYYASPRATSDDVLNPDINFADGNAWDSYISDIAMVKSTAYWMVMLNHENSEDVEGVLAHIQKEQYQGFYNPKWVDVAHRNLELRKAKNCADLVYDQIPDLIFQRWDGHLDQADLERAGLSDFEIVPYDLKSTYEDEQVQANLDEYYSYVFEPLEEHATP